MSEWPTLWHSVNKVSQIKAYDPLLNGRPVHRLNASSSDEALKPRARGCCLNAM